MRAMLHPLHVGKQQSRKQEAGVWPETIDGQSLFAQGLSEANRFRHSFACRCRAMSLEPAGRKVCARIGRSSTQPQYCTAFTPSRATMQSLNLPKCLEKGPELAARCFLASPATEKNGPRRTQLLNSSVATFACLEMSE